MPPWAILWSVKTQVRVQPTGMFTWFNDPDSEWGGSSSAGFLSVCFRISFSKRGGRGLHCFLNGRNIVINKFFWTMFYVTYPIERTWKSYWALFPEIAHICINIQRSRGYLEINGIFVPLVSGPSPWHWQLLNVLQKFCLLESTFLVNLVHWVQNPAK